MKNNKHSDNDVVTKGILKEALFTQNNEIREYVDTRFDALQSELREFAEEAMKNFDWLIGAFKKFDEEHTVLTGRYTDVHSRLDGHEVRIGRLEKKSTAS